MAYRLQKHLHTMMMIHSPGCLKFDIQRLEFAFADLDWMN